MLFIVVCGHADSYLRQPSIDIVHYDISLELTDASDSITGATQVHLRVRDEGVSGMWLDLADMEVDKLRVQGVERRFMYGNGRLSFDFGKAYSQNEIVVVEVQYHGRPMAGMLFGKNSHGRRVVFTNSWPDRAHHWFPSIDHPSDKATADITVTAPEKYDVVSNGRMVKAVSLLDGRKLTRWSEGRAIPTYCMAIGVAEFSIVHQPETSAMPVAWYSYPQDAETAAAKFSRTALALSYFDKAIGPYYFEKLVQVQATIGPYAMENASAIFYDESFFKERPVSEFPVPHEIAHQWFGDSITVADWDHLWLSEGFASYFEALFYENLLGSESLKQAMDRYAKKISEYKFARSEPIVNPGQTDLMKKLNSLTYEKGAWVLHMLRGVLGDEKFFEGIQRYYDLYQGGNALTEDFQKAMESVSGISLNVFFRQWMYQPAWPEYRVAWRWDEAAGEVEISVLQTQSTGLFDMPLEIAFSVENRREMRKFRIAEAAHTFRIPLTAEPSSVEIDPNGWVLKSLSSRME